MKRVGKIVSIVPVIAKADTLTIEERQEFKERVREHTHTHTHPQLKLVFFRSLTCSPDDLQIRTAVQTNRPDPFDLCLTFDPFDR